MKRNGFTLVELLVVIAIVGLLTVIVLPSLGAAVKLAKLASCSSSMHHVGVGLATYQSSYKMCFPPFAFTDTIGNMPLSGHWGGTRTEPGASEPLRSECVNLWSLVNAEMLSASLLGCPAASAKPGEGSPSYFGKTTQFSTYCLRFPYSRDVLIGSERLMELGMPGLFGFYGYKAGGQDVDAQSASGQFNTKIPVIRANRRYRLESPPAESGQVFDPATDAIASDMFWRQDYSAEASATEPYSVRWSWCHGNKFNVLYGDGAVRTRRDDGTVAQYSNSPTKTQLDDGIAYASYAENIWQFFENK